MIHKLIETKHYLLVVDDSDMVGKGYRLDITRMSVGIIDDDFLYNVRKDLFKKIIAHLPLNSPILEGVPLLPLYSRHQEDGIDEFELFLNREVEFNLCPKDIIERIKWYYQTYFKPKEKYKYTEDDMRNAIRMTQEGIYSESYIIKYLHQYPTEFECEMVDFTVTKEVDYSITYSEHEPKPKTITTAQGVQWVGKYK